MVAALEQHRRDVHVDPGSRQGPPGRNHQVAPIQFLSEGRLLLRHGEGDGARQIAPQVCEAAMLR